MRTYMLILWLSYLKCEGERKMICPLMSSVEAGLEQCHEGNCAWWNSRNGQCCIKTIAQTGVRQIEKREGYRGGTL